MAAGLWQKMHSLWVPPFSRQIVSCVCLVGAISGVSEMGAKKSMVPWKNTHTPLLLCAHSDYKKTQGWDFHFQKEELGVQNRKRYTQVSMYVSLRACVCMCVSM